MGCPPGDGPHLGEPRLELLQGLPQGVGGLPGGPGGRGGGVRGGWGAGGPPGLGGQVGLVGWVRQAVSIAPPQVQGGLLRAGPPPSPPSPPPPSALPPPPRLPLPGGVHYDGAPGGGGVAPPLHPWEPDLLPGRGQLLHHRRRAPPAPRSREDELCASFTHLHRVVLTSLFLGEVGTLAKINFSLFFE